LSSFISSAIIENSPNEEGYFSFVAVITFLAIMSMDATVLLKTGSVSISFFPIPTHCNPCPVNTNAILLAPPDTPSVFLIVLLFAASLFSLVGAVACRAKRSSSVQREEREEAEKTARWEWCWRVWAAEKHRSSGWRSEGGGKERLFSMSEEEDEDEEQHQSEQREGV
jgi:hypothetical protein